MAGIGRADVLLIVETRLGTHKLRVAARKARFLGYRAFGTLARLKVAAYSGGAMFLWMCHAFVQGSLGHVANARICCNWC